MSRKGQGTLLETINTNAEVCSFSSSKHTSSKGLKEKESNSVVVLLSKQLCTHPFKRNTMAAVIAAMSEQ